MAHRIALIRHGQTEWSKSGQHTSTTDIDLTDEGVHQAMTIPNLLWGLDLAPATVWSSPRLRAQRTAALAGLHVNKIVDDLAEWAYGDYEGITSKKIHQTEPRLVDLRRRRARWGIARGRRRPLRPGAGKGQGEAAPRATSPCSATGTSPGCWPCVGSGCRWPTAA